MTSSPSGSRMTCGVVGVHERAIFRERTQGKDLEGSLEGKASQEHDPAMSGGRDPRVVRTNLLGRWLGYVPLTYSDSDELSEWRIERSDDDRAVAKNVVMSSTAR